MTQTTSEKTEQVRNRVHGMWAAVAGAWGERADEVDERAAEVTARLLDLADLRPGGRVLELASGPGGTGLAAAVRVAPDGEVVVSDVVPGMVAAAASRAAARGLDNVRTLVLDLEAIDQPDGAYDAVLCREGLMFALDPVTAVREIRRVLRPGGRVAVGVWGPRARNPWLSLVFDAVTDELGTPVPPPGIPGPFALGDPERLAALLEGGPLVDVTVDELAVPLRVDSFEDWWDHMTTLAGPLAALLASLPAERVASLQDRIRSAADPYATDDGIEIPGVCLIAGGRRY